MDRNIKKFIKMPPIEKACVIAVALAEEKYEVLAVLKTHVTEGKEDIFKAANDLVAVYNKLSGGEI